MSLSKTFLTKIFNFFNFQTFLSHTDRCAHRLLVQDHFCALVTMNCISFYTCRSFPAKSVVTAEVQHCTWKLTNESVCLKSARKNSPIRSVFLKYAQKPTNDKCINYQITQWHCTQIVAPKSIGNQHAIHKQVNNPMTYRYDIIEISDTNMCLLSSGNSMFTLPS